MRLTTEVLPRLEARGVSVEVTGEPADYRDVGDSLTIGVSTGEIAGESDWFDLGVTISVEGRELPFAEVFQPSSPASRTCCSTTVPTLRSTTPASSRYGS